MQSNIVKLPNRIRPLLYRSRGSRTRMKIRSSPSLNIIGRCQPHTMQRSLNPGSATAVRNFRLRTI
jgi:hypothetical protein